MLDGLVVLLMLSLLMAAASFLAGSLPLSLRLSPQQLKLIATIGTGVLVGTSLIVIIPEGVDTLYQATLELDLSPKTLIQRSDDIGWSVPLKQMQKRAAVEAGLAGVFPTSRKPSNLPLYHREEPQDTKEKNTAGQKTGETVGDEKEHHKDPPSPHAYIGLPLVLGFVLMYLLENLPKHVTNSPAGRTPHHISLDNLSLGLSRSISPTPLHIDEDEDSVETGRPVQPRSTATTVGLVIHAAAEGVALGVSSGSSNSALGFILFIAILIHKAPAAFGLTSVLLKQGLSKRAARGHLLVFSLATPAGALATWLIVHILSGGSVGSGARAKWWTGMILLFSAGTFLFVAMQSMQHATTPVKETSNGYSDAGESRRPKNGMRDTLAAVVGMLLPLLTQIWHAH